MTSTQSQSPVSRVEVRRSLDRSPEAPPSGAADTSAGHRKPLRVQITRRKTGKPAGMHQFVTQVRFGGAEAVVLPLELGAVVDGPDARLVATAER